VGVWRNFSETLSIFKIFSRMRTVGNELSTWSGVILEKLIVTQLVRKFPEASLPCSQDPTTGPFPSQMNPVHTLPSYFPKIHSNIIFPSAPRSSKWSLPFRFPTKTLYAYLICTIRATCPAHLILLDVITLIIFGEAYKLCGFSHFSSLPPLLPT
jgi:hypothetical protein